MFFEVGGGNGYVSKGLLDAGYLPVVFEPGLDDAKNIKKRGLPYSFCSFFNSTTIHENSVSNIGIFDVLEHIEDDVDFLTQLNNLMTDNGKLYITVLAYQLLWSDSDGEAGHYRRYKIRELTERVERTNFNVLFSTCFFAFLPLPIFIFRALPYRFGFKSKQNKKER